jgi:hypothetical protein
MFYISIEERKNDLSAITTKNRSIHNIALTNEGVGESSLFDSQLYIYVRALETTRAKPLIMLLVAQNVDPCTSIALF